MGLVSATHDYLCSWIVADRRPGLRGGTWRRSLLVKRLLAICVAHTHSETRAHEQGPAASLEEQQ